MLPAQHAVEVRKGYRPFTKNRVRAEKRYSVAPGGVRRQEHAARGALDPDAPVRGATPLEQEDANYDKALTRTLFEYTRAGQLEHALDLCTQTNEPWRAASLRGAIFYHDPALAEVDAEQQLPAALGNRTRGVWRRVARAAAGNPALDAYERALYGALSGELGAVLAVSETWEERLWAYVNARFEQLLERALARNAAPWWRDDTARVPEGGDAPESLDAIFERLMQTHAPGVQAQATEPYHVAQRAVITHAVPALLQRVVGRLEELRALPPQRYARLVRFFAHLALYCRLVRVPVDEATAAPILGAYVDVLQQAEQSAELVALYASALTPGDAHTSYARFLCGMDPGAPLEERRQALLQAHSHALDPAVVARCAAGAMFAELLPVVEEDAGAIHAWDAALSAAEYRLVRALDWLTFVPETYAEAILQANALLRTCMAHGRLHAAHAALQRLPPELLASVAELELPADEVLELDHWRSYFDVLDRSVAVRGLCSDGALALGSHVQQHEWTAALGAAVDAARDATLELLQLGWLQFELDTTTPEGARRDAELRLTRRKYIPEMVVSLHLMLVDTSHVHPGNLAHALALPNVVADERLQLYAEFVSTDGAARNLLGTYLGHVREAALVAMDRRQEVFHAEQAA